MGTADLELRLRDRLRGLSPVLRVRGKERVRKSNRDSTIAGRSIAGASPEAENGRFPY